MRTLTCIPCNRTQQSGKFCLDCGKALTEKVTLGVSFKPIECNKDAETVKSELRKWLARIGVQQGDIQISRQGEAATVEYTLLKQRFTLKSWRQKNLTHNLAAIEQFLHYRVLGIERGIEDIEQAFAGYAALPAPKTYAEMTDDELRDLLKRYHPDTGRGQANTEEFMKVKAELDRRA